MYSKTLNKIISILITITFLLTNTNMGYGDTSSRSLFKNKKVDYDKITSERQDTLQKKQAVIKGDDAKELEAQEKAAKKILQANLGDISQIHIPQEMGRIVEVYQAPLNESRTTNNEQRLIVGIQDLHTNPEAELNLAKILDILLKDYKMGLVCSEGADGVVDTSSISSFPDTRIKEKVSRIFVDSGELTGEEYLSITKYPDLPIWGIEDKDIYFKNILDFNKIMKFNPNSQVFISQTKKAVEELKPKIYSKDLIELDKKELEFSTQKLDTAIYIAYLIDYAKKLNVDTSNYKNIALLNNTTQMEKTINQSKIMSESSNLILYLQSVLMNKNLKTDLDTLMARAKLFNDQKSSPFSFYSYLKDLALKHIKEDFAAKYPEFNNFIDYLTKINSLDSTKLFLELENLNFEIKETIAKTDEQKLLIKASRNINFLESFFNLKVSNEDLDYYINNREEHKVAFFKDFLSPTLKKYNINAFIDYNPALIDNHFQELEEFYKVVKDRDVAMVKNSLSEIEKRDVKLASLVHGGFHTKGITSLLREKGYSYIIVSPYSKTDMDEENYHFLLQGRRKPITELLQKLDLSKIIDNLLKPGPETLRINLGFDTDMDQALQEQVISVVNPGETLPSLKHRMEQAIMLAGASKISEWNRKMQASHKALESRKLEEGKVILKFTFDEEKPEYMVISKTEARMVTAEEFDAAKAALQSPRGADIGVVKGLQHMAFRQFIKEVDGRKPEWRSEDLQKMFEGLPESIHIQGIPKDKEMGKKTGLRGHYTARRHSRYFGDDTNISESQKQYYIYIDEAELKGKNLEQIYLIVAEELYELIRIVNYGFVNYRGYIDGDRAKFTALQKRQIVVKSSASLEEKKQELVEWIKWFSDAQTDVDDNDRKNISTDLVEWLDQKGNPQEVYGALKNFHNNAPKLDEREALPDLLALEKFKLLVELFYKLGKIGEDAEGAEIVINLDTGAITWNDNEGNVQLQNSSDTVRNDSVVQALFNDIINSSRLKGANVKNLKYSDEDKSWLFYIPTKAIGKLTKDDMANALLNAAGWNRFARGAGAGATLPISDAVLEELQAVVNQTDVTFSLMYKLERDDGADAKELSDKLSPLLSLMAYDTQIRIEKGTQNVKNAILEALEAGPGGAVDGNLFELVRTLSGEGYKLRDRVTIPELMELRKHNRDWGDKKKDDEFSRNTVAQEIKDAVKAGIMREVKEEKGEHGARIYKIVMGIPSIAELDKVPMEERNEHPNKLGKILRAIKRTIIVGEHNATLASFLYERGVEVFKNSLVEIERRGRTITGIFGEMEQDIILMDDVIMITHQMSGGSKEVTTIKVEDTTISLGELIFENLGRVPGNSEVKINWVTGGDKKGALQDMGQEILTKGDKVTIAYEKSGSPLGVFGLAMSKGGILADGNTASLQAIASALDVSETTASRDVAFLIAAGVLIPVGRDTVKVASQISSNQELKKEIYLQLRIYFSHRNIGRGFGRSDDFKRYISSLMERNKAYQIERSKAALAMQYGRPLYELLSSSAVQQRGRIGGAQGRRLFTALYNLGWIGPDFFSQRVIWSRVINTFSIDKEKVDIVGFDGAKVADDVDKFIIEGLKKLSDTQKAALIVTDGNAEEILRQAPGLQPLMDQGKVFIVRLRGNSLAAERWSKLLEGNLLYDFKKMGVQGIIENRALIEALATAK